MAREDTSQHRLPLVVIAGLVIAGLVAACTGGPLSGGALRGRDKAARVHAYKVPPGIHKIKHVIIIMQENRSFDSYFGTYPGADGIAMNHGVPIACVPSPGAKCGGLTTTPGTSTAAARMAWPMLSLTSTAAR